MLSPTQKEEISKEWENIAFQKWGLISIPRNEVLDYWLNLLDRELGRREEIIDWCKERCEANKVAFGTDKWNIDLEELIEKYEKEK